LSGRLGGYEKTRLVRAPQARWMPQFDPRRDQGVHCKLLDEEKGSPRGLDSVIRMRLTSEALIIFECGVGQKSTRAAVVAAGFARHASIVSRMAPFHFPLPCHFQLGIPMPSAQGFSQGFGPNIQVDPLIPRQVDTTAVSSVDTPYKLSNGSRRPCRRASR
jgi:hypothetical protein